MNPKSYRILVKPVSTRVRCPVCHEEVYSRAGIHPQCAVRQCDPPRAKNQGKITVVVADPVLAIPGQVGADAVSVVDLATAKVVTAPGHSRL